MFKVNLLTLVLFANANGFFLVSPRERKLISDTAGNLNSVDLELEPETTLSLPHRFTTEKITDHPVLANKYRVTQSYTDKPHQQASVITIASGDYAAPDSGYILPKSTYSYNSNVLSAPKGSYSNEKAGSTIRPTQPTPTNDENKHLLSHKVTKYTNTDKRDLNEGSTTPYLHTIFQPDQEAHDDSEMYYPDTTSISTTNKTPGHKNEDFCECSSDSDLEPRASNIHHELPDANTGETNLYRESDETPVHLDKQFKRDTTSDSTETPSPVFQISQTTSDVNNFIHFVGIAGGLDSYLSGRLKSSIKHLVKLLVDSEH